jgi:hypothetical protein
VAARACVLPLLLRQAQMKKKVEKDLKKQFFFWRIEKLL